MSSAMELSEKSLETIGRYVRQNLPGWLQELELPGRREWELQLTERIVRVEEELKVQRELMVQGFAGVEKRLDQVDRRIDQVDKRMDQLDKRMDRIDVRFEQSTRQITVWLGLITVLIALIGSMGAWGLFAG